VKKATNVQGRGRGRADAGRRPVDAAGPYHHGALRTALLQAAERILERDGIQGLTLRGAAREAGVSHAAPKNHFGDLTGLLSDLAAVGFDRLSAAMQAKVDELENTSARRNAIGLGYVEFARQYPGLFLLMFRSERLDFSRPALNAAARAAFGSLTGASSGCGTDGSRPMLTLDQAAHIARSWSMVHGLSMLLIDGRLKPIYESLPDKADSEAALLAAIFSDGPRST
jgi:AcrR family transcriptional regulator